jgi:hypothetical protein
MTIDVADPPLFHGLDFIRQHETALSYDLARSSEAQATQLALMYTGQGVLPGELSGLDTAVLEAFGCSLTGLLRVLWYLLLMAKGEMEQGKVIAETSRAALIPVLQQELARSYQPRDDETDHALQLVTMDESRVAGAPFDPELARDRAFRPGARPVIWLGSTVVREIKISDGVAWVGPAMQSALEDWAMSIVNCVWPFALDRHDAGQQAVSDELLKLKNDPQQGRAIALEQLVAAELRRLPQFCVKTNLACSRRGRSGDLSPGEHGLKLRNEIDVLAVDEGRQILWVISVKDPSQSLSSRRIGNVRSEFFENASPPQRTHQAKLHDMVEDIRSQANEAAIWCGARESKIREVRGAFVTRSLCPAAFDTRLDPAIEFLRVHTVADIIGGGGSRRPES